MTNMVLECNECSRAMTLEARRQREILDSLKRPAQVKIIECICGKFQFILSARQVRGKV